MRAQFRRRLGRFKHFPAAIRSFERPLGDQISKKKEVAGSDGNGSVGVATEFQNEVHQ